MGRKPLLVQFGVLNALVHFKVSPFESVPSECVVIWLGIHLFSY